MSLFEFLHTYSPSPVLAEIGSVKIYWYGTLYVVSFVLAYWIVVKTLKKQYQKGKAEAGSMLERLPDFALGLIVIGLIGARLYHVLNEWPYYAQNPSEIVAVWHGGLAIHGALLAGVLYVWWYAARYEFPFFWLADVVAPTVLLGQAIGRFGNYFNQELFGRPTNLPWGIPIDLTHRPPGYENFSYFHPAFLYESLWDFTGLVIIFLLRKQLQKREGMMTSTYLFIASSGRIVSELFRIDEVPLLDGIRWPLIVAVILLVMSIAGVVYFIKPEVSK